MKVRLERRRAARHLLVLVVAAEILPASGCATVAHGPDDFVPVVSDPPAKVWLDGRLQGRTPLDLPVDRLKQHTIVIAEPKFDPVLITTDRAVNRWFVLADVCFLPGILVDLITDRWYEVLPAEVTVTMKPSLQETTPSPTPANP